MFDELIDQTMEKEAASEAGKAFLYTLGGGLASAGVAYGIPAAIEGVRVARTRANKDRYLAKMQAAHPEIKDFSKRDKELVYNSLTMHSPKILKDPLVGGQVMLEALRRGNHMDMGQLANVSKMTGGAGATEHEREAANILARQMGTASSDWAGRKYDKADDSRLQDALRVEDRKGRQMRSTETYKQWLQGKTGKADIKDAGGYKQRYRAYRKAKST